MAGFLRVIRPLQVWLPFSKHILLRMRSTKKAAKYIIKHSDLFTDGDMMYAQRVLHQKKMKKLLKKARNESSQTGISDT